MQEGLAISPACRNPVISVAPTGNIYEIFIVIPSVIMVNGLICNENQNAFGPQEVSGLLSAESYSSPPQAH